MKKKRFSRDAISEWIYFRESQDVIRRNNKKNDVVLFLNGARVRQKKQALSARKWKNAKKKRVTNTCNLGRMYFRYSYLLSNKILFYRWKKEKIL